LNLLLPEEDISEEAESLAGDIADRNETELENAEDPKFAVTSKGESGESSKFTPHPAVVYQNGGGSIDEENKG
jgi:hypothetical protein